jgi:hypothetical protein
MRIFVLALEGAIQVTAVLDNLAMANSRACATGVATAGFDITAVGM